MPFEIIDDGGTWRQCSMAFGRSRFGIVRHAVSVPRRQALLVNAMSVVRPASSNIMSFMCPVMIDTLAFGGAA